jgi:hypothetical protein
MNVNVPAGTDYLEVQSLSGGGTYQITAKLTPTVPAFLRLATGSTSYNPIAAGRFFGPGSPVDIVAPDGIHVGNGDGTFRSETIDGPLVPQGSMVTAITVADLSNDNLPDIAYTEINSDYSAAWLCVLLNQGGGNFRSVSIQLQDTTPFAVQAIDFGNGVVDLAVADSGAGDVTIFYPDGQGGFSPGQVFQGLASPIGLVTGRFGDGHIDLIVADGGDPFNNNQGQGLTVIQANGPEAFYQLPGTIDDGAGPSAIVAGDFKGNGSLDLAVADSGSNQVSILLNNGDGTFQAPRAYLVGSLPQALVAGDFGNGSLDLAVANSNSNDLSVLLGNGDGTFQPQLRFGSGLSPSSILTADFNGDGRLDLAAGNYGLTNVPGSLDISILLGRGDGTFQDSLTNPVGNGPVAVVTADLTHNGHTDIITANYYSNDISVLLGNGDGTFQAARTFPAGIGPNALAVADFNGDGRLDVAVADRGDQSGNGQGVSILPGNGDGTFLAPVWYPAGTSPVSIVTGDWTGSGVVDLAVANNFTSSVTVLMGDGRGGFNLPQTVPLGDAAGNPVAITAGYFSGNGVLDLAVADQSNDGVSILLGDGRGGFVAQDPIPLGNSFLNRPAAILAGDFGNGVVDLAVALASSQQAVVADEVSILLGHGDGTFDPPVAVPLGEGLSPSNLAAGHFFSGGQLDLAVTDQTSNSVSLLQGDGRGGFQLMPALQLGSDVNPNALATGDFTGNGRSDLAIASQSPNSVVVELNQGSGQFAQPGAVGLVPHNTPLVADLSGGGVPDVAIVDGAGDILFRQGQPNQPGSFSPPVTVNPGRPSRDIAAVRTNQGTLLASVDATDNAVSLFAYRDGGFILVGSLATGLDPAQIVSADLMGIGREDLVIRNAGDGTLTVYPSNGQGGFLPPINLAVGSGISDVSLVDVNQDGLLDILLANQTAGEVEVMLNQGGYGFDPPALYRAGVGLAEVTSGPDSTSWSLMSQEGTVGVAAASLAPGGPPDLVALNSGSATFGVLDGLGGGRFGNPTSWPTSGPARAIRIADFNGDGVHDLAILGSGGLSIWLGIGTGGFVPGATYDVGPDATGLAIAHVNGDKIPDLVVGNSFGDVLVLLGNGNGTFQTPVVTDRNVGLEVIPASGNVGPAFIFVNQARDRIVVQNGRQAEPTVVADRTAGLLVPGAPVLADLNGDGILDLIVPNSGGNNVLVYPGLTDGGFGPALNNGNGFAVGTNPVSVTVADVTGDGRPDLIVANQGSNDVSILINKEQASGFTFVQGPRLRAGQGPVGVLYGDFTPDGIPALLVSDSGSKNLLLLPSLGNGFFNDVSPTIVPLSETPGPIFAGPFEGGTSLAVVVLDPNTGNVTLVSGWSAGTPTSQVISSGGLDPVAALPVQGVNGFEDLVVANNADGRVSLLRGGPDGLTLAEFDSSLVGRSPTGLALGTSFGGELGVYAATEGVEAASLLMFSLTPSTQVPSGPVLTLLPLQESSIPLIATLSTTYFEPSTLEAESSAAQGGTVAFVGLSSTTFTSVWQRASQSTVFQHEEGDDGELAVLANASSSAVSESSAWRRVMMGFDEAFEELRRATQPDQESPGGTKADDVSPLPGSESPNDFFDTTSHLRQPSRFQVVDEAIGSLASETPRASRSLPKSVSDGSERPRNLPLEDVPSTWLPFAAAASGFLLTAVSTPPRSHGPGLLPIWRTKGLRKLSAVQRFAWPPPWRRKVTKVLSA